MAKRSQVKKTGLIIQAAFLLLLLLPFWVVWLSVDFFRLDLSTLSFDVVARTVWQAFLSATVSVLLGAVGMFGLFDRANLRLKEFLTLLPNFLPVLFSIFALLLIFENFPYGLQGLVLGHTVLNAGIVSVLLAQVARNNLGDQITVAHLHGQSRFTIIRKILFPNLQGALFRAFLLVFSICFTSFAVPLVLGGGKWPIIETRIYEIAKIQGDYSLAAYLAFMQSIFVFILALLLPKESSQSYGSRQLQIISVPWLLAIPIGLSSLLLCAHVWDLLVGFGEFFALLREYPQVIFEAALGSLSLGVLTGVLTYFFFSLLLYSDISEFFDKTFKGLLAPSTAIIGFAFLVLTFQFEKHLSLSGLEIFLTGFGLSLMSFGFLYRFRWAEVSVRLKQQRSLCELMGASRRQSFSHVLYPQAKEDIAFVSAISAFWGAGDFALSKILLGQEATLGLLMESLLARYQFEGASWVMLMMLLSGGLVYYLFRMSSYVSR